MRENYVWTPFSLNLLRNGSSNIGYCDMKGSVRNCINYWKKDLVKYITIYILFSNDSHCPNSL